MSKRQIKHFASDNVLEHFYKALASDKNPDTLVHIPLSDVFYVRRKYYEDTGHYVSLDRMERAMYLEGLLRKEDVLDPERKREWEK